MEKDIRKELPWWCSSYVAFIYVVNYGEVESSNLADTNFGEKFYVTMLAYTYWKSEATGAPEVTGKI